MLNKKACNNLNECSYRPNDFFNIMSFCPGMRVRELTTYGASHFTGIVNMVDEKAGKILVDMPGGQAQYEPEELIIAENMQSPIVERAIPHTAKTQKPSNMKKLQKFLASSDKEDVSHIVDAYLSKKSDDDDDDELFIDEDYEDKMEELKHTKWSPYYNPTDEDLAELKVDKEQIQREQYEDSDDIMKDEWRKESFVVSAYRNKIQHLKPVVASIGNVPFAKAINTLAAHCDSHGNIEMAINLFASDRQKKLWGVKMSFSTPDHLQEDHPNEATKEHLQWLKRFVDDPKLSKLYDAIVNTYNASDLSGTVDAIEALIPLLRKIDRRGVARDLLELETDIIKKL